MKDFTIGVFKKLCQAARKEGYGFMRFLDYSEKIIPDKFIVLRHDVDKKENSALALAAIEKNMDIKATYYFRCENGHFNSGLISKISDLGHEIGYHYESLSKTNGDYVKALNIFKLELGLLRKTVEVKTISAHGSPFSRWDSRLLWLKYNLKDFNIIGDASSPTLPITYITDTGRKWNGASVNVRDRINDAGMPSFSSTFEIIKAIEEQNISKKLMISAHPHRWSDSIDEWLAELIFQNIKNIGKYFLVKVNR